ncbi:MAG: hypothetical protein ACTSXY_12415 [Promethearchaeota archaeon]
MIKDIEQQSSAPFNMAVATLMRLDAILTDIKNIVREGLSKNSRLQLVEAQRIKYNLVKQFFIQAIPLLRKDDIESLKKDLEGVSFNTKELSEIEKRKVATSYSPKLENKMNDFLMEIQLKLQASGNYFMPPKGDPKYSWKES